jgi:hypothetical protein
MACCNIAESEWSPYKHVIKQLYVTEGNPLKEVISIMEKEYKFEKSFAPMDSII